MTLRDSDGRSAATLTYSVVPVGSTVTLALAGELDYSVSDALRRTLRHLVESSRAPIVVVDMSNVRLVDASCIGVIVAMHTAAAASGRRVYVDGLHALPARVFALLGLHWLVLSHRGQRAWPHE